MKEVNIAYMKGKSIFDVTLMRDPQKFSQESRIGRQQLQRLRQFQALQRAL